MKHPKTHERTALAKITEPITETSNGFQRSGNSYARREKKTENITVSDYRNLNPDIAAADAQKSGLQPVVVAMEIR